MAESLSLICPRGWLSGEDWQGGSCNSNINPPARPPTSRIPSTQPVRPQLPSRGARLLSQLRSRAGRYPLQSGRPGTLRGWPLPREDSRPRPTPPIPTKAPPPKFHPASSLQTSPPNPIYLVPGPALFPRPRPVSSPCPPLPHLSLDSIPSLLPRGPAPKAPSF